jgi:hypothetical protein
MADATESRLPGVMQKRMQSLQALDNQPPASESTTPTALPDAPTATVTPPAGENVQLSREVYNELLAASEKANTAAARADREQMRREEMEHRLTELENAAKAVPVPATPAAPAPVAALELTEDERTEFADSLPLIRKIAAHEADTRNTALRTELIALINEAINTAKGVETVVQQTASTAFQAAVREKVPDLRVIIAHKHWADFLDAEEPVSGLTYQQLLAKHLQNKKADGMANVYKIFRDKYMQPAQTPTGYDGISPSGGAVDVPADSKPAGKLKLSDRKKASDDYKKGKITYAQLQQIDKKFEEAEEAGNIDHNA